MTDPPWPWPWPRPRPAPFPDPGGTALPYEPREHRDDTRREGEDFRFVLGGRRANQDGDLDRRADFRGFTAGYRVGASLVGACDPRGAFRDVEARAFRGAGCFVAKFGIADVRVAPTAPRPMIHARPVVTPSALQGA